MSPGVRDNATIPDDTDDGCINSIAISLDNDPLAVDVANGSPRSAMIWDIEAGLSRSLLTEFRSVTYSTDSHLIALPQDEGLIKIQDPEIGNRVITHDKHHEGSITSIAFSPDGIHLEPSKDCTIKLWDVAA
ncbi:hypothetical protein MauCBS54593_003827 [Microsporum audouinii]